MTLSLLSKKPIWKNLLDGACPKCNCGLERTIDVNPLYPNVNVVILTCPNPGFLTDSGERCGFRIRETRAREIAASLAPLSRMATIGARDPHSEEENLHALNWL